jgi:tetratricopeptide (TPR) repeat protein
MMYRKKYWLQCAVLVLLALCLIPLVRADENTSADWLKKGNAFRETGQYQEALEAYTTALSLDPSNIEAWSNKGNTLYHLARYDEALDAVNRALLINPDYPFALNNKGLVLQKLNRTQEALEAYDRALSVSPDFALAQKNREKLLNGGENLIAEGRAAPAQTPGPGLIRLGIKPMPTGPGLSLLAIGIGVIAAKKGFGRRRDP